jgi:hypothetical protein
MFLDDNRLQSSRSFSRIHLSDLRNRSHQRICNNRRRREIDEVVRFFRSGGHSLRARLLVRNDGLDVRYAKCLCEMICVTAIECVGPTRDRCISLRKA